MHEPVIQPGHILTGTLFSEPMRVETVHVHSPGVWEEGTAFALYQDVTRFVIGSRPM